jgi:hypothetical protein
LTGLNNSNKEEIREEHITLINMPSDKTTTTTTTSVTTSATTSTTSQLYQSVQESVEKVKAALEMFKKRVSENDSVTAAGVKTTNLVQAAKKHVESALSTLSENVPESASDAVAKVQAALIKVSPLLDEIKTFSAEKYASSLESVNEALKKAFETVSTWRSYAIDFALNRVSSLDTTFQLSSKTVEWASIASEQSKLLDTKYNISENVEKLTAKAKELSEFYSIQEKTLGAAKKCQEIGDTLTGARITPLVDYVTTLAVDGYATGVEGVKLVTDAVVTKAAEQNSHNGKEL